MRMRAMVDRVYLIILVLSVGRALEACFFNGFRREDP